MKVPNDLVYTATDEWVKADGKNATLGITDYAQDQLSDVVYVEFIVSPGDTVSKGQQIATIESVKAAAEVNLPVSGKVVAVNESLPDKTDAVNLDPYGEAWLLKVELNDLTEVNLLMDSKAYEAYCQERSH